MQFEELFEDSEGYNTDRRKRVGGYVLGKTLGEGSFAKVRLASHIMTKEKVAVKVINKRLANKREYVKKNMRREAILMQKLEHPNIVRLYEVLETENSFYMVVELAEGGNFLNFINRRRQLSEQEARRYIRQIISAVDHIHRSGVLHRDLKIENLMLDRLQNIKIIDFGLSNTWDGQSLLETQCGSPAYSAPEIFSQKQYGPPVDVWSIGVNLYAMLTGSLPFTVEPPINLTKLHAQILRGCRVPEYLSSDCQDLIKRMLEPADHRRITIPEILRHPWLNVDCSPLQRRELKSMLNNDDINTTALTFMLKRLDLSEGDIRKIIVNKRHNATTAIYHLLCQRLTRGVGLPDRICLDNIEKGRAESVYKQMRKQLLDENHAEILQSVSVQDRKKNTPNLLDRRCPLTGVASQSMRSASGALALAGSDIEGDIDMEERGVETQEGLPHISREGFKKAPPTPVNNPKKDKHIPNIPIDGMLTTKNNYKQYLKELQKQRKRQTDNKLLFKPERQKAVKGVHMNAAAPYRLETINRGNSQMNIPDHSPKGYMLGSGSSENRAVRFNENLENANMTADDVKTLSEKFIIRKMGDERRASALVRHGEGDDRLNTSDPRTATLAKERVMAIEMLQKNERYPTPPPPPNSALGHRRARADITSEDQSSRGSNKPPHQSCSPRAPVYKTSKFSRLDAKENVFYEKYRFKYRGQDGERASATDIRKRQSLHNKTGNTDFQGLRGRSNTMPDLRGNSGGVRKLGTVPDRTPARGQSKETVQFRKLGVYYSMPEESTVSKTRPRKQPDLVSYTPRQNSSSTGRPELLGRRPMLSPADIFRDITDNVKPVIHVPQ